MRIFLLFWVEESGVTLGYSQKTELIAAEKGECDAKPFLSLLAITLLRRVFL